MIESPTKMNSQTTPNEQPEIPSPDVLVPSQTERQWSVAPHKPPLNRLSAIFEVIMCSGYPTQLIIGVILAGLGMAATSNEGELSLLWIFTLSMTDTALLLGLIIYFLLSRKDSPREVFLGTRPILSEVRLGAYLVPVTFFVVIALVALLNWILPGLRNVPENPFEVFLRSPGSASLFAVVAVVAGGLREELQRAFILVRFEQHLGGAWIGLAIFSIAFGLGHYPQGWDAVIITGLLGAFWGLIYLIRRSVVSTILCHAGFNLTEILVVLAGSANSSV